VACNWPSAVAPPSRRIDPTETTTSWPTTTPSWPTATSPWSTTTTESILSTVAASSSLCTSINPCGEHGKCVESPKTVPSSARRFACVCSDNWFGRLCDKNIDELTTPQTMVLDQNKNIPETIDTIALPVKTEKDSKYIFYGLTGSNTVLQPDQTQKRQSISK